MKTRKIKIDDTFDGYKVIGNCRWDEGCKDLVWDVRHPEGFIVTITETALRHYIAAKSR